jgi:hypothetical protein
LPDGIAKKPNFGSLFEGHGIEKFGIFYGHFRILWPFGLYCGNLVYVFPLWYFTPRQIWQPLGIQPYASAGVTKSFKTNTENSVWPVLKIFGGCGSLLEKTGAQKKSVTNVLCPIICS